MTATKRPMMPAVECTSWCDKQDGHPDEFCREDQACWSPAEYVELSLPPVHREKSGDYPQRIGVMAQSDHVQTVVYVHLLDIQIHPEGRPYNLDASLHLAPDEADRLADQLREKAALVRAEEGGHRST